MTEIRDLIAQVDQLSEDRIARNAEIEQLRHRTDYLQREINLMRKAMQHAGTWDQFCADYAAYKAYREEAQGG